MCLTGQGYIYESLSILTKASCWEHFTGIFSKQISLVCFPDDKENILLFSSLILYSPISLSCPSAPLNTCLPSPLFSPRFTPLRFPFKRQIRPPRHIHWTSTKRYNKTRHKPSNHGCLRQHCRRKKIWSVGKRVRRHTSPLWLLGVSHAHQGTQP